MPRCDYRDCEAEATLALSFGGPTRTPPASYCDEHASEVRERFLVRSERSLVAEFDCTVIGVELEPAVDEQRTTHTYVCRTPGCENASEAALGRNAYCRTPCQVQRGTRNPDGTMVKGPIPHAPGTKARKQRRPNPTKPREQAAAVPPNGHVAGDFERRAAELVAAARGVDEALGRYRAALESARMASAAS